MGVSDPSVHWSGKGYWDPLNLPSKSACPAEHSVPASLWASSSMRFSDLFCGSSSGSGSAARAVEALLGIQRQGLVRVRAWDLIGQHQCVLPQAFWTSILSSSVWHTTCHKQVCKGLHWLRVRDVLVLASQARMVRPASRSKPDMQQQGQCSSTSCSASGLSWKSSGPAEVQETLVLPVPMLASTNRLLQSDWKLKPFQAISVWSPSSPKPEAFSGYFSLKP